MVHRLNDDSRNEVLCLIGTVIASLPFLGFRLFREYLRFKTFADKAGKIFYNELLSHGISHSIADELTCSYLESRDLLGFISKM